MAFNRANSGVAGVCAARGGPEAHKIHITRWLALKALYTY